MNATVVDALKEALKTKPNTGICGILIALDLEDAQYYYELMFECCEELNVFSGSLSMPITVDHGEPSTLYRNAKRKNKLWNSTTKYGAARRNVAQLMIERLENE